MNNIMQELFNNLSAVIKNKILIISGVTASGKSTLALLLAKQFDGVIINADASQLYKETPIISAQPVLEEQQLTPHKLYSIIKGDQIFTVKNWIDKTIYEIYAAQNKNKTPILVGGSGMYIDSLVEGISNIPNISTEISEQTQNILYHKGLKELYSLLIKTDPSIVAIIHPNDVTRIIRAYNIVQQTGKSILYWQKEKVKNFPRDNYFIINVLPENRELLYQRCNQRFEEMLQNNAIKEVENLLKLHYKSNMPIMKTIAIREIAMFLDNEISKQEAIKLIQKNTRNYAKRQYCWFKNKLVADKIITEIVLN